MQITFAHCAGLDVHKRTVVACAITPARQETRTFGTLTAELRQLAAWLQAQGITQVAMESTGVYWQPVFNVLEDQGLTPWVVNAQHIKAVPGRKTDVKDAAWIADLLQHGLLQPSLIPSRAERERRELVRYRQTLIRERAQLANRVQKLLEGANIKLASVASDIFGVSGRAILTAMAAGQTDPAGLAQGSLRLKQAELQGALTGVLGEHQRLLLKSHLRHLTFLDEELTKLDAEVQRRMTAEADALARLDTIPGVGPAVAEAIVAEIGTDMSRFPTAAHLASWAKLCPGNKQSGGQRHSVSTGHGNRWLRPALVQAARAAARKRDCYLAAQYHRLAARRGTKRAAVAVAHSILVISYKLLQGGGTYQDLGGNYFDERHHDATVRRLYQRLARLGEPVPTPT